MMLFPDQLYFSSLSNIFPKREMAMLTVTHMRVMESRFGYRRFEGEVAIRGWWLVYMP